MDDLTTSPQTRLTDRLSRAGWQVEYRIQQVLQPAGVTIEQWRVLCCLSDGAGHAMSEIASYALVPRPTLTKQVDKLADRALVYRHADHADRRRVLVFLSARGRQLFRELEVAVSNEEARIVDQLGAGDADDLFALLGALIDRLPSA
ncbi:MarR family winged helix-turn-helix transcriptional regulator [Streptomyces sp. NL15-2K]|uniref:MarR family winged helix-turn-helix transcriptional regulator n=1 Tax=Streptomyces sp. NL15-2K TaxID=376149 RepID=UPI000FF9F781|nr:MULTISPECIES: MarR family transcriptional regulator [Actinomycetes]WKX09288.1 MarR family transcriptional regulator [Kutzneria buriramensis]GCB49220.1 marR family transcriptional regulator [Streptomyces sp. NL15-2K]